MDGQSSWVVQIYGLGGQDVSTPKKLCAKIWKCLDLDQWFGFPICLPQKISLCVHEQMVCLAPLFMDTWNGCYQLSMAARNMHPIYK